MKGFSLYFAIGWRLLEAVDALPQTSSTATWPASSPASSPAAPTRGPSLSDLEKRQEDPDATCGYPVDIYADAVTCSSGRCALLSIFGQDKDHIGCCSNGGCDVQLTCLEEESATDRFTLGCTGSPSRCATYSWVDQGAVSYSCATVRTTQLVYSTSTTETETTQVSSEGHIPTVTSGGPNTGSPLGTEYDLAARQRIGAGVGSGIFGCLLLGFFAVFGCLKRPQEEYKTVRRDEKQNQQVLEDLRRGAPAHAAEGSFS